MCGESIATWVFIFTFIYNELVVHHPAYGAWLLLTPAVLDSCAIGARFIAPAAR